MTNTVNMQSTCRDLRAELSQRIKFKPDDRFIAALGEFFTSDAEEIEKVLKQHFSAEWDAGTMGTADQAVQDACNALGGIYEGQRFMAMNTDDGNLLFCAWWPWSNGAKISIRIGPWFHGLDESEKPDADTAFMQLFQLR